jgi:hypothetical protein
METATPLPPPDLILERMNLCRVELAELKRLLRAVRAAGKAEEARRARQPLAGKEGGRNE